MINIDNDPYTLLKILLQSCKNICAIISECDSLEEFKKDAVSYDNIYMNLLIITETYQKTQLQMRENMTLINWDNIRDIKYSVEDQTDKAAQIFSTAKYIIPHLLKCITNEMNNFKF